MLGVLEGSFDGISDATILGVFDGLFDGISD